MFVSQYRVMLSRISSLVSSPVALVVRSSADIDGGGRLAVGIVVVEEPRGQADGGVGDAVQGLRARCHVLGVVDLRERPDQLLVGTPLGDRERGRRRIAELEGPVDVGRNRGGHVGVDGEQADGRLQAHLVHDEGAPVPSLGDEAGVPESRHQFRPGSAHSLGPPARRRRLPRESVAGHRRDHHVECVSGAAAMRRRIGESIDELELLDDRAGPSVIDDEWQRAVVVRAGVDEVDVEPVDLGDELRQGVQLRLHHAPVVRGRPVVRESLHRRQLHALRRIRDGLLLGPLRGADASTEVGQGAPRERRCGTGGSRHRFRWRSSWRPPRSCQALIGR